MSKAVDSRLRLGMKCGDCLHFNCVGKFKGDSNKVETCENLGRLYKANAPDCFFPDYNKLNTLKEPEIAFDIGKLVRTLKPSQLRVLAYTLVKSSRTIERQKLKFGQPVFFTLGRDYISHYFKGYVIGVEKFTVEGNDGNTVKQELVIVTSRLKKSPHNIVAHFKRDSLLTVSEWKKKHARLLKADKVFMSEQDRERVRELPIPEKMQNDGTFETKVHDADLEKMFDSIEIPTIDHAPEDWYEKHQKSVNKGRSNSSSKAGRKPLALNRGSTTTTEEGFTYRARRG